MKSQINVIICRDKMSNILIIDDEKHICDMLNNAIGRMGHNVDFAHDIKGGIEKTRKDDYDIVLLDVRLPDGNGLSLLPEMTSSPTCPEVIIMTGNGDPDGAEAAIKNGAWDYIQKPLLLDAVTLSLTRALQYRQEKMAAGRTVVLKRDGIIGISPTISNCLDLVAQASLNDTNVIITGETGTGKELFAYAIHENSRRRKNNFVVVDCAALPETLVESTLFGHVKGTFTGADRDRDGLIRQADKGTLFLDEIGELPLKVQKSFLRVLQERRFRPVGGKDEIKSDFRLVAATNRDLNQMVREGKFRQDLFFRINSIAIDLPPLRERGKDIRLLATNAILGICQREKIGTKGFSPEFMDMLEACPWPGNVRELKNVIEGAISKARYEPTLFPKHLPEYIRINLARSSVNNNLTGSPHSAVKEQVSYNLPTIKEFRETILYENEKHYLNNLLSLTNGNIREACRISGLGRARLYDLMKTHGIQRTF